jgi:hypothetical protein
MINDEHLSISITLSPMQVDEIVRAASHCGTPSVSRVIANLLAAPPGTANGALGAGGPVFGGQGDGGRDGDSRLSRSLLRGLSILTCFGPDRPERGIVEMARDLGMSASTAHRYALTLVELGLLERCPKSRKYRLPGA